MFRVSAIASCLMVLAARTPVQVHKTVIIACCNQLLIVAHLDDIDVTAIGARGIDAVDKPAKLDSMVIPLGGNSSRGTTRNLFLGLWVEEK